MDRGIRRIAVVNRGEAAMRLINAARELRYESVRDSGGGYADLRVIALHTRAERTAMFVREADEAVCLDDDRAAGAGSPYLDLDALERALVASRADAAWVGWGFVAERPEFAELCERLGVVFIGPSPDVMRRLGDKIEAKHLAERSGVPVAPLERRPGGVDRRGRPARRQAIGFPLMIKATAGGGGRGIRRVDEPAGLADGVRERPRGGAQVVRRRHRVHGAGGDRRPARGGADHRRRPWHGLGGRRARLQHAAAQPEGDRGVAAASRSTLEQDVELRAAAVRLAEPPATATPAPSSSSTSRRSSGSRSSRSTPACRSSTRSPS